MNERWPDPRPKATFHFGEGKVEIAKAGPSVDNLCAVVLAPLITPVPIGDDVPEEASNFDRGSPIISYPDVCALLDFSRDKDGIGAAGLIAAIVAVHPAAHKMLLQALRQV